MLVGAALLLAGCGSSSAVLVPIGAGLRGPKGFEATVYARGLRLVSALAFDRRGRLWAATSGATKHANDGVYLVARPGARPVKIVSGLRGPLGLAWVGGRLFVSSLGRVDAFARLHGTRFARRTTILRGPARGAENNNLVLAPDGRLLMGVSATCDHCNPPSRFSGAIVSFRPDGSDLRVHAARIRAAFGLAVDPATGALFATMNQRDDLGGETPGDWLAVVHEGESWGFPGCYGQGGAACNGVPKPVAVLDKHAAAGGVALQGGAALVSGVDVRQGPADRAEALRPDLRGLGRDVPDRIPQPAAVEVAGDAVLVGDWGTGIVYRIARAS